MRSLAGIRARLDELLTAHGGENQPPSAVILLPSNGREPIDDIDEPLPRVRRTGAAAIVIYDPAMGQPTPEAIRQLIDGMVTP
jgi:hypothetical protein